MPTTKVKSYKLEDIKAIRQISEQDIMQWKEVLLTNIKAEPTWAPLVRVNWQLGVENKGFDRRDAAEKSQRVDEILTYISTFAPIYTFREITKRCDSLEAV